MKMQKPSILLIDDSLMMRRFIALYLSGKYQVTDCATAEEAIRLVKNGFRPQLVISDLDLPGMSGMELIGHFQSSLPATPLIIVSGAKESKTRIEALALGADDFLTKPFHPAELDARIGKLLRRGKSQAPASKSPTGFLAAFRRYAAAI